MSERYDREIAIARDWFKERLPILGPIVTTRADYQTGIDALPPAWRSLSNEAFRIAMTDRKYELSYQQTCRAMFAAASDLGLLTIVEPPKIPQARWVDDYNR